MTASASQIVQKLQEDRRIGPQLVDALYLPPVVGRLGELDPALPATLAAALAETGAIQLWQHQVEGIQAIRRGDNLLVTTPTASGKSLIFHTPVIEEALIGGAGRALFLYPLKALGQDQKAKFDRLAELSGAQESASCEIFDGDTTQHHRQRIKRDPPRVLISNPDMLHFGMLSYWQQWEGFLKELRWLVIDELHTYRGIFGSHFHHVVQRLLRICRSLGSDPTLIASSATAANADEFATVLTGQPFVWISESGAPREGRHFLLVRPDASPYTAALQVFSELLEAGLKTIVFTKARRITELMYSWLQRGHPELSSRVASYRSGFLPEERRAIEAKLFEGRLDGVISTSALEMGIDVGGLDACILVGYPGSVMATWQRSGRVGRADRESVTVMVAMPDALDQYLLDHPREFLERPCEQLIVDPLNEPVSRAHLVCAAAEKPLRKDADAAFLEPRAAVVGELLASHELVESADGQELVSRRRRPQRKVSLRGANTATAILDLADGRVIGTVDGVRSLRECHPGAVYLHAGRQYLVRELDLEAGKAHAEVARVDYFTVPLTEKETRILEVLEERQDGPLRAWLGRLRVTERVVGYERKRIQSREAFDRHTLELPPIQYETVGFWWSAPRVLEEEMRGAGRNFMGALHAAEHASISLLPLLVVCDRGDIGGISIPLHPQVKTGCVFVYDGHPGGVGIAARAFQDLPEVLDRVRQLLEECECEEGCPSCVQSPKCGNGNRPLDKGGASYLIQSLLGDGDLEGLEAAPQPTIEIEAPDAEKPTEVEPMREVIEAASERLVRPPGKPDRQGTLLFDLETQRSADEVGGWQNAHRMLVAIGVVCFLEEGRLEAYPETRIQELIAALESAELVIGFNSVGFDYKVLSGYSGVDYKNRLPTLDLLQEIRQGLGFRLSLNHLAKETLGVEKSADGLQSLEWFRQGRMDLVEEYCRRDVEILRDLYLFGRRMGHLFYRDRQDRKLKLPVRW